MWQAGTSGMTFPVEMSHHIVLPATRWFTTWREVDHLAVCVSPQHGCAAAIAEKLISAAQAGGTSGVRLFCLARVSSNQALLSEKLIWAAQAGGTSGVRLFSLARVSSNQALLSYSAVWVLASPAVRQLPGPALWAQAGRAVRQLFGPAVWAPTGPAVMLGGFNVSNLMGITRRIIDIGKKMTFYFLQNV